MCMPLYPRADTSTPLSSLVPTCSRLYVRTDATRPPRPLLSRCDVLTPLMHVSMPSSIHVGWADVHQCIPGNYSCPSCARSLHRRYYLYSHRGVSARAYCVDSVTLLPSHVVHLPRHCAKGYLLLFPLLYSRLSGAADEDYEEKSSGCSRRRRRRWAGEG